jgi:hypothetical protein
VALQELGYEITSVKQMTELLSPEEGIAYIFLALFLVTLLRSLMSQEIFKLSNIRYNWPRFLVNREWYRFFCRLLLPVAATVVRGRLPESSLH